jgi:hypothetical protein
MKIALGRIIAIVLIGIILDRIVFNDVENEGEE